MKSVCKNISIVIPTFQRSEILAKNLPLIISRIRQYSIQIFISDNSHDDKTKDLIKKLNTNYKFIYYEKNLKDIGHDKNSIYVLQVPKTNYVWLLGDGLEILENGIEKVLKVIETYNPGLISVNVIGRNLNIKSRLIKKSTEVFSTFGWHMTLTGCTIYSRKAINSIRYKSIMKCKNFPQIPLMFNFLNKNEHFYWINDKLLLPSRKKGYWTNKVFSIFLKDLEFSFNSLTYYPKILQDKVFLDHSLNTDIFGFFSLLALRSKNAINSKLIYKNYYKLKTHSNVNIFIIFLVSIIPIYFLKKIISIRKNFKK